MQCRRGPALATTAASRQSRFGSSRLASVSVPGVTMRATLRSTGPLLVAGSPTCSTITALSPSFINRARCGSIEWIRHAGHRDRRARRLTARGQRDVEESRGALRIVVEQLVEVAHPVEHQLVRMVGLDAQVLLHHRRVLREVGRVRRAGATGAGMIHSRTSTAPPGATSNAAGGSPASLRAHIVA